MNFILNVDTGILNFVHDNFRCGIFDFLMPYISLVGNKGIIWIIVTLAMLCTKKFRSGGIILATSLILCLIIGNLTLKPLVARIRPFDVNSSVVLLIPAPTDFSFPSGHTLSSFAEAGVIFYVNKKFGIWAYLLASLIAFSRLYLYVHYPSDILAGVIIGTVIAIVSIWLNRIIFKSDEKK